MIAEAAIRRYAGENRVDVTVARQEIVLTILLERVFAHAELRTSVALKGGTALRKLVFGSAGRFSEDMDFVTLVDDNDGIQAELIGLLVDEDAAARDGVRASVCSSSISSSRRRAPCRRFVSSNRSEDLVVLTLTSPAAKTASRCSERCCSGRFSSRTSARSDLLQRPFADWRRSR